MRRDGDAAGRWVRACGTLGSPPRKAPSQGGLSPRDRNLSPPSPAPAWPHPLLGSCHRPWARAVPVPRPAALAGKAEPAWGARCGGHGEVRGALAGVGVPSPEPRAAVGEPRASPGSAKVLQAAWCWGSGRVCRGLACGIAGGPGATLAGRPLGHCPPPRDAVSTRSASWGTGNWPSVQEWPGSAGWELSEVRSNFYLRYTKESFLLLLSEMLAPLR